MVEPFEEVNFLIRSENRVDILTTLAAASRSRSELVEHTGISDVTVNRCLDKFRDRGWVRETDAGYEATSVGALIAEEYAHLEDAVDIAARIGPHIELLPIERMDFDLRHLTAARVTDPDEREALRVLDRWVELIYESDHIRTLVHVAGEVAAEAIVEAIRRDGLRFEAVIPPHHLADVKATPTLRESYREIIEAGGDLSVAAEDPEKPYSVAIYDELVAIAGFDERGSIKIGIESRSDPVRDWVERTYTTYAAEAQPLASEDLTA